MAGAAAAGSVALSRPASAAAQASAPAGTPAWSASGTDLTGWQTVLGDGQYAGPGQAPVDLADIATVHNGSYSELSANVKRRGVMAQNITFTRQIDPVLLSSVHVCQYSFRLPYLPSTKAWPDNAQTLEGGFFVWDGGKTRFDYGVAFQWVLNPWLANFGDARTWTSTNNGSWAPSTHLTVDTNWHTVQFTLDIANRLGSIDLDGVAIPAAFSATPKTGWGTETAGRLQAEVISLWPGSNPAAPSHRGQFQNWSWNRFNSAVAPPISTPTVQ